MKNQDQESIKSFREKLDMEYTWPARYTFKFIVPSDKKSVLVNLFQNHDVTEKQSSKGNYISITAKIMAPSSDFIIDYYIKASKIEGVISL